MVGVVPKTEWTANEFGRAGIDPAKKVFHVTAADAHGEVAETFACATTS